MFRGVVAFIASVVVAALVASGAGAHDGVTTAAGHAAEDSVVHTAAQERALEAHTRAVTAGDAGVAAAAVAGAPQDVGEWGPVVDWPVIGIHAALLPNGKVLAYDSLGNGTVHATVWDPATGAQTAVNVDTGFNIFCSGLAHLVDGRLFLAGGNREPQNSGIVQTHLFDSMTNSWSLGPNMLGERWYPSVTPLNNGELLITSGRVDTPEVRTLAGGLRALSTASLGLPLYPWIDVAPNGRAFYSGPDQTLRALNTAGTGSWQAHGQRDTIDRDYGGRTLFDVGKLLVAGGGPSTSDARVINLNGPTPQVSPTAPMASGRRQHNLTVLADGTVLATGGNSSGAPLVDLNAGVYAAEQWNPATGQWRTLAAMQVTRQYHSIALLLPDGRVLSAGGGFCGTCDQVGYLAKNAEIYSPPYLFQADGTPAPRPAIDAAPAATSYGAAMQIATANPASIRKAALVRLGAVTHSNNMEQRYIPLSFTTGATNITATAPANANVAPPGPYMLFIIDANGVPSVARMVSVQSDSPPTVALTQPMDGATFTPPATVTLEAIASDADGSVTKVEFFNGAAKLGEDTTVPYSFTWSGVAAGNYTLTARATDNLGATSTSGASQITVSANTSPTVTLTQPTDGATFTAPATVNLGASASDPDGSVAKVEFFNGAAKLGEDTTAPYSFSWGGVAVGSYTLTARATDNLGATTTSVASTITVNANAAAAYSFNEGVGVGVADSSGNGNSGAIGSAGWAAQGRYGGALSFNGLDARVTVADAPSLRFSTGMTLEAWVSPSVVSASDRDVVFKGNRYFLEATSGDGGRPLAGGIFAGSFGLVFGPLMLPLNTWTHLATTYDGVTLRLFVNGAQVTSAAQTGTIESSSDPLQIGGDAMFGQYFAGRIDEVRVYDRALTQAQIEADLTTPIGGGPPSETEPPSAPSDLTATAVSQSQVDLAWAASTDNVGVTGYRVERCQGAGCTTFVQVGAPIGTALSDPGLSAATTYRYRVRAADAAGNLSGYSAIVNAATPDTQAPTVPTGLSATAVSASQINLSWTASTDNVAVANYRVERCQGATCTTFVQVATPTGATYNDTGLTTGTTYRYRVRAADAAGNLSGYSAIQNAATTDTQAPTDPTGLSATAVSQSQVNLAWTGSTDNVGVVNYRVERCQGATCTTFVQVATPTGATYNDTGLSAATTYRYRVRAADAAGNFSGYTAIVNATTPDTQAPTDPTGLSATAVSASQINLAWTASTDNVAVANYRVERCDGAACTNFLEIGTPTGPTFADTGLAGATTYRYRVRAVDAAGNLSGYSAIQNAATTDTQPPTDPTGLTATAVSGTQIDLAWTGSTDNVAVANYRVERCQGAGCTVFVQVATPTGTTYSDIGLQPATTYRYRVRAVDAAGNLSGYTAIQSATTPDSQAPTVPTGLTATAVSQSQIDLAWTASTDNVALTGYRVERCQGATCTNFVQVATPTTASYSDAGLVAATTYRYRARAEDTAGNLSAYSTIQNATTPLAPDITPPTAPSLTASAVSASQINLAWSASTDNVAVTGYRVERCQGSGCTDFVQIATPSGIFYNDTGLTAATSYSYRVRAADAAGNLGGYSSVVSATTLVAGICSRSSAVWLTGMEHGVVSTAGGGIFSSLTGSPTADNTVARSGAYSLRIADASTGSTVRALRSFTASSVVVARFALRLSSLPGVNANLAYVDSGTDLVFRYNAASQRFELMLGNSIVTATTPVSAATWYVIDLRYDVSASPHLGDWRVNGVTQTQVSRIAAPTTANGLGMGATANASVYTANYDDIFVATQPTAYPVEDSRIARLVPNSMGTSSGAGSFRNNDGTAINSSSWQRLDDAPMTSTADYVRQQANSGSSYVELGLQDTPETCIREVSVVLAYHAAANTADNGKTSIFEGATETGVFTGDMSQTGLQYKTAVVTPASVTWNQAAVNGLVARVGYSTDSSPNPYWDSIMLEAAVL